MRITLYRPDGNNGVQLLMTSDALSAHDELQGYRHVHGDDVDDAKVRGLRLRLGFGTFTFTSAPGMLMPGARQRHYGTYDMLDHLSKVCEVVRVSQGVSVPFSNGPDGYAADFKNGYGVKPGYFPLFIRAILDGYDNSRRSVTQYNQ